MSEQNHPTPSDDGQVMRRIRSFVKREGRLSKRQALALEQLYPKFGLSHQAEPYDLAAIFGQDGTTILEIGFGMGKSLVEMASQKPENNYLGIEVHRPGVGACLADMQDQGITNLRVIEHDAVEILRDNIAEQSLDVVQLFFPDPWHKKRHHKRRIVQADFVEQIRSRLKIGGLFHMATDWENYAEHMLEVMQAAPGYRNHSKDGTYVERPKWRPLTKFENRGQKLGHGVWDLIFERTA